MNKVAHYLQEHLVGEVMTSPDARKYFATDTSIFSIIPAIIVYPRTENDVRKTTRFTWQLAERGRVIPITSRGSGTDQGGAAIGSGIMLVFPAHMNRILELDGKTGSVVVEPGINYGKLQQTLHTHSRFLPPFPVSYQYSTVGGAVSNNASGEKSVKYGDTRAFVEGLRVVLANGEVIETGRISKRELSKKLGLATLEGEIYRSLDTLIEENQETIQNIRIATTKNAAGYAVHEVKRKDGSFDLTPLLVGSQGTLGIITEVTMATEAYNPTTTLIVAYVDDVQLAQEIVLELRKLPEMPSAIEVVDDKLLSFVHEHNPNQLKNLLKPPFAKMVMLIEFDSTSERIQKKMTKKTTKLLDKYQISYQVEKDPVQREELWKIRQSASSVMAHAAGGAKALPVIEDGIVPPEKFSEYISAVYKLFQRYNLKASVWGHAGDANLHMQPLLDLSQTGDRQKIFRLIDDYYNMVIEMGGSTTGEHNDGRLRGPYLQQLYGQQVYEVFSKVKQIFDPYNTLNPGVKMNVTIEDLKPILRNEYSLDHLFEHMPRL
jgi:FAD/FMN-containing dehydrogenase